VIKRIAEWKVTTDEWRGERQMLRVGVEARSELQHRVLRSEISGHAVRSEGTSQATCCERHITGNMAQTVSR
jgi:hypothetical protein